MVGLPQTIRTGGQSGADVGALYAGLALGYIPGETLGGWAPKGYVTEFGKRPWLRQRFGLLEHTTKNYLARTRKNVEEAQQVIVFGEVSSAGSSATLRLCQELRVPYWVNPTPQTLQKVDWGRVMVAGNRESGNRGIEAWVDWYLRETWREAALAAGQKYAVLVPPVPPAPRKWSPEDQWSPLQEEV